MTGAPTPTTALSPADEVISADEHELAELKDMWTHRELSTREYRQMRKTVEDRISALRRKTIVRPTVEVLAGDLSVLTRSRRASRWAPSVLIVRGKWAHTRAR